MSTPASAQPLGEPFSEALSEAAQAAAMSVRLILTIADAVRRAAQRHHDGKEKELPDGYGKHAEDRWAAAELGKHLPAGLLNHLAGSPDWPVMARQLMSLAHAGVDLTTFLPNLGHMASAVERAVAHNVARTKAEGTDRWADLLRATIPEGLVRDAILASPAWPDIAAAMGHLHDQGADVARILTDAHAAGLRVDQAGAAATARAANPASPRPQAQVPAPAPAVRPAPAAAPVSVVRTAAEPVSAPAVRPAPAAEPTAVVRPSAPSAVRPAAPPAAAPPAGPAPVRPGPGTPPRPDPWATPAVSSDAKRSWGPLTEGLDLPHDLDLGNRSHALQQLGINETAHTYFVAQLNEHLPQQEAAYLVSTRQWPLIAARMRSMDRDGVPLGRHLARLASDDAPWRTGSPAETPERLLLATHHALTTPLDQPLPTGPRVSTTAARSRSTTAPTNPQTQAPAPAGAAVQPHRQQTAPAPRQGRGR
ncbi:MULTISPECIES: hypothetical protein [unclassified Streptomyces]|uniref:hypothetical protein n=1 Tax=unclassified Streptomyces TaxID=2593676 RepID=UPI0033A9974D